MVTTKRRTVWMRVSERGQTLRAHTVCFCLWKAKSRQHSRVVDLRMGMGWGWGSWGGCYVSGSGCCLLT